MTPRVRAWNDGVLVEPRALYNEIDPFCCDVLRARIADGWLPPGDVLEKDVRLIQPDELNGYQQIHLFAGIGGGGLACRIAGVPDDFRIVTAGVPCQPASQAGKRLGAADERWLWPEFFRLLCALRSHHALVEQPPGIVSLNDGHEWRWILGTLADLREDFEVSRVSAGDVGAPQERERIWIVAYPDVDNGQCADGREPDSGSDGRDDIAGRGASMGDGATAIARDSRHVAGECESVGESGRRRVQSVDDSRTALEERREDEDEGLQRERRGRDARDYGELLRPWSDAVAIRGADDTVRLIPHEAAETGPQSPLWPVADGLPGRVARLRSIGNAWCPQAAGPALRVILARVSGARVA